MRNLVECDGVRPDEDQRDEEIIFYTIKVSDVGGSIIPVFHRGRQVGIFVGPILGRILSHDVGRRLYLHPRIGTWEAENDEQREHRLFYERSHS